MATENEVSEYMKREETKREVWNVERARILAILLNAGYDVSEFETNTVGAIKNLRIELKNRVLTLDKNEGWNTTNGRKPAFWEMREWLRDGEKLGIMGRGYEASTDADLLELLKKIEVDDANGIRFESFYIGSWIFLDPSEDGKWRVWDTLEDSEVFSAEENAGYRRSYDRNVAECRTVLSYFADDEWLEINCERSGSGGGGDLMELCPDPKKWVEEFREKRVGRGYLDMLDTLTPYAAFGCKSELLDSVALIRVGDYREALDNARPVKEAKGFTLGNDALIEKYWVVGSDDDEDEDDFVR